MNGNHTIPVEVGPRAQSRALEGRTPARPASGQVAMPERPSPSQTPLIDIYEGQEGLVLEADLPGVSRGNLTIQIEENVLTLQARVSDLDPEELTPLHEEFSRADFQRSFILSDEVDRDRISAELNNGVLRLTLPKAERARPRRIEIKAS